MQMSYWNLDVFGRRFTEVIPSMRVLSEFSTPEGCLIVGAIVNGGIWDRKVTEGVASREHSGIVRLNIEEVHSCHLTV